jgi:hypothetical protein
MINTESPKTSESNYSILQMDDNYSQKGPNKYPMIKKSDSEHIINRFIKTKNMADLSNQSKAKQPKPDIDLSEIYTKKHSNDFEIQDYASSISGSHRNSFYKNPYHASLVVLNKDNKMPKK